VREYRKCVMARSTAERNILTKAAAAVQAQIDALKEIEDGWQEEERDKWSAVRNAQDSVENVEETSEESGDE
jgi:uncharacterized phage-like protein YoqJ